MNNHIKRFGFVIAFSMITGVAMAVDDATIIEIDSKATHAKSQSDGNNSRIQALEAEDVVLHQRIDNIELTPGPQGEQGEPGPQGIAGPIGPQGPQGLAGAQGPVGATGPEGPQGLTGADGAQGPEGSQGLAGAQGPVGATGPEGPQGLTGADGAQGPQGLAGAQGPVGATGPEGPQGLTGADGAQGPEGSQGLAGAQGPVGATGPEGPQGLTGADGAQGPQGLAGAQGPQGEQGLTGATGATGATGSQGLPGEPGALANLACDTSQVAIWDGSAWACADFDGAATSGWSLGSEAIFTVDAGTFSLTSPDWTRFGGGVIFRPVQSFLEVGELVLSGLLAQSHSSTLISSNFDFSINSNLEPNTISVSIGDIVFPTIAAPWDGVTNWASFSYNEPEPVTMTVRLQNIPSSGSIPYLWFMEIMQGNMLYYDLQLTAGLGNELEYQFVHCLPTSYDAGAAAVETLTISCDRVEFNTTVRTGFFNWLTEQQLPNSSAERDVFVEFFDDTGNSLMGNNYQGTFISSYRFPRFDKGSSAPLSDAVRLKADSVSPN